VWLNGPGDLIVRQADLIVRDQDGRDITTWTSNGNRRFFGNLRPGRYYVLVDGRCRNQLWAPQWFGGTEDAAMATPIDLVAGELRRIEMALVTGGRIAGELLTAAGERPDRTYCRLSDADGVPLCAANLTLTDGFFDYTGLPDGVYHLAVPQSGGVMWWYPGTTDFAQATGLTISGHAVVTDLTWRLPGADREARP
jgi:hypothetical protein